MPTAILLISEQTLPNILFIKQMGPFDRFIFLTTEKMEKGGQSDFIIRSARLHQDQVKRVEIDPENANISLGILEQQSWPDEEITIHLTGGTKMMALATYAFFAPKKNCQILYLPIHTANLIRVHPNPGEIPLTASISFEEYLSAYGVAIQSQQVNWMVKVTDAQEVMDAVLGTGNMELLNLTAHASRMDLSSEEKKFYTGEWLEIWLAWAIHTYWGVPETDIRVGVKLNRVGVPSTSYYEYDVMFIRNSRLYVGECKFFNSNKFHMSKIHKELFKFASVTSQLGLYAKPFFVISNFIDKPIQQKALEDQCKILRLPYPADLRTIGDSYQFTNFLLNL